MSIEQIKGRMTRLEAPVPADRAAIGSGDHRTFREERRMMGAMLVWFRPAPSMGAPARPLAGTYRE